MKNVIFSILVVLPLSVAAQTPTNTINNFMDDWHKAAATADEEAFFGSMTSDGVYLGTDKTEKWTRDEMKEWAKEIFQRETAWAFTATQRDVYFADDGNTAWISEKLDTWMGTCKGTAVLVLKEGKGWKIALYDLSVTIDNDKVDQFLELIEKE